jgi:tetratricopeptide (TPR) repeat protein
MKLIQSITLSLLFAMFVSCIQWGSSENNRLIREAYMLVDMMPGSALTLLDSINTAILSDAEEAAYSLLRIQAKDNAGLDLSIDFEIFRIREFFIKRKDWEKAALACFYAGKVVDYTDRVMQEVGYYLEGLEFAKKTNNEILQGKILYNMGYLKFDHIWYSDAFTRYQLALSIYQTAANKHQHEVYLLIAIGNMFIVEQKIDSAQHYFNTALDKAKLHDDHVMQALVYNKITEACVELKLFDMAKSYGTQALRWAGTDAEMADICKNLAQIFNKVNIIDSARYYIVKAESFFANMDNLYELADFYYIYHEIEKQAENYSKALEYHDLYTTYRMALTDRNENYMLLEFQKKQEIIDKERNFYISKRKMWRLIGLISLAALSLTYVVIALRNKNRLQKTILSRFQFDKEKIEQKLVDQQIIFHEKSEKMRIHFLEKLGIIKKITLLNTQSKPSINIAFEINAIKSELSMQKFIDITEELYPGFTSKLKNSFSDKNLSEQDIGICCLIVCGFSNKELALFVYKKNDTASIQKWKTRFRKKLNIPDYGNIRSFLLDNIDHCE